MIADFFVDAAKDIHIGHWILFPNCSGGTHYALPHDALLLYPQSTGFSGWRHANIEDHIYVAVHQEWTGHVDRLGSHSEGDELDQTDALSQFFLSPPQQSSEARLFVLGEFILRTWNSTHSASYLRPSRPALESYVSAPWCCSSGVHGKHKSVLYISLGMDFILSHQSAVKIINRVSHLM